MHFNKIPNTFDTSKFLSTQYQPQNVVVMYLNVQHPPRSELSMSERSQLAYLQISIQLKLSHGWRLMTVQTRAAWRGLLYSVHTKIHCFEARYSSFNSNTYKWENSISFTAGNDTFYTASAASKQPKTLTLLKQDWESMYVWKTSISDCLFSRLTLLFTSDRGEK